MANLISRINGCKRDHKEIGSLLFIAINIVSSALVVGFFLSQSNDNAGNQLAFAATKVSLKVENLKVKKGPTSALDVSGKVRNNTTKNVEDVKLMAAYYDNSSALLGKTTKFLSNPSQKINPGQVLDFSFPEIVTFERLAHYNVNATANEAK
jgi:hypothetical protein